MTNTKGYRRGTRYMFARNFRKHGVEHLTTYLRVYKRGDQVQIVGNGAFQKGLPHKYYHGRMGRVYNVTRRGLGVIVNKRVRGRILPKMIQVRIEHVKPRGSSLKKVATPEAAIPKNKRKSRVPAPRKGHFIFINKINQVQDLAPLPFEFMAK